MVCILTVSIDGARIRMAKGVMEITLDNIAQDIADRLQIGAESRKSPIHTAVIGTSDGDLRVMVLREFDADTNTLRFHTDSRSPKVAALANGAAVSVLAYDPDAKIQIRMRGVGRIEATGPLADAAWNAATPFAKRCYLAEHAPSDVTDGPTSGLPGWVEGIVPTPEQVAAGRANFAILLVEVKTFDWLYLANSGHRRARFVVGEDSDQLSGTWLVP